MYVITKSPLTCRSLSLGFGSSVKELSKSRVQVPPDLSPLALVHRLRNYLNLEYRSRQITANKIGSVDHDASDWSIHGSNS